MTSEDLEQDLPWLVGMLVGPRTRFKAAVTTMSLQQLCLRLWERDHPGVSVPPSIPVVRLEYREPYARALIAAAVLADLAEQVDVLLPRVFETTPAWRATNKAREEERNRCMQADYASLEMRVIANALVPKNNVYILPDTTDPDWLPRAGFLIGVDLAKDPEDGG